MSNPAWICVVIEDHLRDCPPWDQEIPEDLIPELALHMAQLFDYTPIFDQLDQLACNALRQKGLGPSNSADTPDPVFTKAVCDALDQPLLSSVDFTTPPGDDRYPPHTSP